MLVLKDVLYLVRIMFFWGGMTLVLYWLQICPYYDCRIVIYDSKMLYKIGHWSLNIFRP